MSFVITLPGSLEMAASPTEPVLPLLPLTLPSRRRSGGAHDLNLTVMYADRIYMLHGGRLAASGTPRQVLSDDMIARVFECRLPVGALPADDTPFVLPQSARQV